MNADVIGGRGGPILSKIGADEKMCQLTFKTTENLNIEYSPFIPDDK